MIKQIYPLLDGVYIREPLSGRVLDQIQVHNYEYIPDALFAFQPDAVWSPPDELANRIDFSKPYICLGDSSGFYTDRTYPIEDLYKRLILKLRAICPQIIFIVGFGEYFPPITKAVRKLNVPFVSVLNSNYVDLYHLLKEAKIFISGRWHTSILSLLAETPILLFGSDSHKTEALYEMIEYPYPLFDVQTLPQHVDDIINATKQICSVDNHRHFQIVKTLSVKALDNAKMLSADGKYSS